MIRTDKRLCLCWTLLLCNLAFIWGNSLLPGEVSQTFSDWVKNLLAFLFDQGEPGGSGGLLRKLAHFTEFASLGMLLAWLYGMLGKGKHMPLFWGVCAAALDETIQIFVPERGPSIWDVLLDSSGVLTGMVLLHLGHTYCTHYLKNHHHTWRTSK